jgi:hypothetical protein
MSNEISVNSKSFNDSLVHAKKEEFYLFTRHGLDMRPLRQVSPLGLGQVRSKMDALGPVVNANLDKEKILTFLTLTFL